MRLIQPLLILGFLAAALVYFGYLRSMLRDRLIAVLLFAAAVVAIVAPGTTSIVAGWIGVGRGTDLVLYLFALFATFAFLVFYLKIAAIQEVQTKIVRTLALERAVPPRPQDGARG